MQRWLPLHHALLLHFERSHTQVPNTALTILNNLELEGQLATNTKPNLTLEATVTCYAIKLQTGLRILLGMP